MVAAACTFVEAALGCSETAVLVVALWTERTAGQALLCARGLVQSPAVAAVPVPVAVEEVAEVCC